LGALMGRSRRNGHRPREFQDQVPRTLVKPRTWLSSCCEKVDAGTRPSRGSRQYGGKPVLKCRWSKDARRKLQRLFTGNAGPPNRPVILGRGWPLGGQPGQGFGRCVRRKSVKRLNPDLSSGWARWRFDRRASESKAGTRQESRSAGGALPTISEAGEFGLKQPDSPPPSPRNGSERPASNSIKRTTEEDPGTPRPGNLNDQRSKGQVQERQPGVASQFHTRSRANLGSNLSISRGPERRKIFQDGGGTGRASRPLQQRRFAPARTGQLTALGSVDRHGTRSLGG